MFFEKFGDEAIASRRSIIFHIFKTICGFTENLVSVVKQRPKIKRILLNIILKTHVAVTYRFKVRYFEQNSDQSGRH